MRAGVGPEVSVVGEPGNFSLDSAIRAQQVNDPLGPCLLRQRQGRRAVIHLGADVRAVIEKEPGNINSRTKKNVLVLTSSIPKQRVHLPQPPRL